MVALLTEFPIDASEVFECLRFAADVNGDSRGLNGQFEVDRGRLIHQKISLLGLRAETGPIGRDDISAGHNLLELVFAAAACNLARRQAGGLVHDGHGGAGNQGAGGVRDRSPQRSERCLRPGHAAKTNHQKQGCKRLTEGAHAYYLQRKELSRWHPLFYGGILTLAEGPNARTFLVLQISRISF